jgi:hypothetical protein
MFSMSSTRTLPKTGYKPGPDSSYAASWSDAQEHLGAMLRNTLLGLLLLVPPLGKCRATDWLLHRSPKANGAAIGRPPCLAVPRLERRNRGSVCQPEAVKANPNLGLCLSYRPSRGHRRD